MRHWFVSGDARMHLLPTFRWRLASVPFGLDYPYWVDDGTFDVEYHVREIALPSPGNQRQLAEQEADLIGRQLASAPETPSTAA